MHICISKSIWEFSNTFQQKNYLKFYIHKNYHPRVLDGKSGLKTLRRANQRRHVIKLIVSFCHSCKLVIFLNHQGRSPIWNLFHLQNESDIYSLEDFYMKTLTHIKCTCNYRVHRWFKKQEHALIWEEHNVEHGICQFKILNDNEKAKKLRRWCDFQWN